MTKEIIQIQLAWFFSNDYVGGFEDFALKLKTKLGESKITQYMPIHSDAPSEIPRLVLVYEKFNINISKNRFDLFFVDFQFIKNVISIINEIILTDLNLHVGRIGFVKKFFAEGSIKDLITLLPKEKIENIDLKEINIRINSKKIIESYGCNNIENLITGFLIKKDIKDNKEIKKDGLVIERDINTLTETLKTTSFKKEDINKLLDIFNEESEKFILLT